MTEDSLQRFIFDGTDVRGEIVQLHTSYQDVLAPRQDSAPVAALLGEFLAAASLLGSTLKFEGTLTLQAQGNGSIPLIMAETTHDRAIRGIVRGAEQTTDTHFEAQLGTGSLAITLDPLNGERYQGIVPLVSESLAASLEGYFNQSVQLPTRLWLAADGHRAAGLLLQALPAQVVTDIEARQTMWQHLTTLAATLTPEELLSLGSETVLYRLFHEETVRLLDSEPVRFRCSCSQERTGRALSQLGEAEVRDILLEQGAVEMQCEFCLHTYRFSPVEIDALFSPEPAPRLH
ncbi:MAG TPA: Hsp33 family molecular chaperone HslO [Pseudomonadales bacterium]